MYPSLLAELADCHAGMRGSGDQRRALLFSIPSLLNEEVFAFLYHELSQTEDPEQPLLAVFHELISVRAALDDGDTHGFPDSARWRGRSCSAGGGDHTWEEEEARLRKDDFRFRFSPE